MIVLQKQHFCKFFHQYSFLKLESLMKMNVQLIFSDYLYTYKKAYMLTFAFLLTVALIPYFFPELYLCPFHSVPQVSFQLRGEFFHLVPLVQCIDIPCTNGSSSFQIYWWWFAYSSILFCCLLSETCMVIVDSGLDLSDMICFLNCLAI